MDSLGANGQEHGLPWSQWPGEWTALELAAWSMDGLGARGQAGEWTTLELAARSMDRLGASSREYGWPWG